MSVSRFSFASSKSLSSCTYIALCIDTWLSKLRFIIPLVSQIYVQAKSKPGMLTTRQSFSTSQSCVSIAIKTMFHGLSTLLYTASLTSPAPANHHQQRVLRLAFPIPNHHRPLTCNLDLHQRLPRRHHPIPPSLPSQEPPLRLLRSTRNPNQYSLLEP